MNDSKDHKAAAEPPLDCRVMRSDWQSIDNPPQERGWYEYAGWLIEGVPQFFWNGWQWGYWLNHKDRTNWTHLAESEGDKWRGILAHNSKLSRGE
jgi:hypothetical protein